MSERCDTAEFPALFVHEQRAGWGVSVLSGESDGKRRYLFEGGEERTMGQGALDLMRKVEEPDRHQRATYARLVALLAKRKTHSVPTGTRFAQSPLLKQLAHFHAKYSGGLHSADWQDDPEHLAAREKRSATTKKVALQLSDRALDKLPKGPRVDTIWKLTAALLSESALAGDDLEAAAPNQQSGLGVAVRDLLHGQEAYEKRFDHFIACFESAFGKPPGWQTATALSALMFPTTHVYVEPNAFRKQLKALARSSPLGARPSGASYTRCLEMARTLANQLAAKGEVPRDLFDVHDFIRSTVSASGKA
jgi:hypothetical protein